MLISRGKLGGTTSRGAGLVGMESSESPGYCGLAEAKSLLGYDFVPLHLCFALAVFSFAFAFSGA